MEARIKATGELIDVVPYGDEFAQLFYEGDFKVYTKDELENLGKENKMRTIKFRGKRIDNKEWVYGYLYKLPLPIGDAYMILTQDNIHLDNSLEPKYDLDFTLWVDLFVVDPETVGQFTGLTDKNGKEIYEGDIVSHPWKDPIFGDLVETGQFVHSTICFNNGAFVVNYRLDGEYIYLQDFLRLKCLEVVGNIHDNPELIKK